ncbi:MAG: hypothetical protein ACRDZZ_09835 [Ilumatobacteraceae bacterium]
MTDVLWIIGFAALLAGLYFFAFRIDPHWVSKDGRRFICQGQLVDHYGNTLHGWREYRFEVLDHDRLFAKRRSRWSRLTGKSEGVWRVSAKSENPPKNREIYLLTSTDTGTTDQLAIRMPASSRAVEVLDGLGPK